MWIRLAGVPPGKPERQQDSNWRPNTGLLPIEAHPGQLLADLTQVFVSFEPLQFPSGRNAGRAALFRWANGFRFKPVEQPLGLPPQEFGRDPFFRLPSVVKRSGMAFPHHLDA